MHHREENAQCEIRLEPFRMTDCDALLGWVKDREFLFQLAPDWSYPLSRGRLEEYFKRNLREATLFAPRRVVLKSTGEHIGHLEISLISSEKMNGCFAHILIGPEELRGKGYGKQAVLEGIAEARDRLLFHDLELNVFIFNQPAIRCYLACGFDIVRQIQTSSYRRDGLPVPSYRMQLDLSRDKPEAPTLKRDES